ncbi:hypothetical protein [Brasilonema bromeliae]|uniref:Uncharacterized protein n=1 Tax=Brasilonema bromeliae SPC951 TaxID=385972 RepID=A0ABX1P247_9CYAN|nr:hypothetical protein [Brasilonema bromeliae]NMG18396.1 hypothetical protein [Brasilonema bromeliae SPC951]
MRSRWRWANVILSTGTIAHSGTFGGVVGEGNACLGDDVAKTWTGSFGGVVGEWNASLEDNVAECSV